MIVAAAIRYKNVVYTGVRHCEIFKDLIRLGHDNFPLSESNGYYQGFIGSDGCFYDRENAKRIVKGSGQKYDPHANVLTSEDLW